MKKLTISLCILGFALTAKAQVGVNTTYPRGVFNVDGGTVKNTNTTIPATIVTESTDDVVVDATGKVGIGTNAPAVKLDIETGGTDITPVAGFKLADGNQEAGKILISDANGVGTWQYNKGLWQGGMYDGSYNSTSSGAISFETTKYYEIGEGHGTFVPSQGKIVLPFTGRYRVYTEAEYNSTSPSSLQGGLWAGTWLYDKLTNTMKKTNTNWIAGNTFYPVAIATLVVEANAGDYIIFKTNGGPFHECSILVQLIDMY